MGKTNLAVRHLLSWSTMGWLLLVAAASSHGQTSVTPAAGATAQASAAAAQTPAAPIAYAWRGQEADIEAFLATAPITHFKDIPVGITKPRRGYFAPGGPVASMAWKPLAPGLLHGKMESYKSEVAAYLLNRHLGMDMVPPVVERKLDGVKGAAVYWIEGVRPWNPGNLPKAAGANWSRLTSRMLMFDQLIANIDRNQGNLLHDDNGHLYLIDHSRAFTTQPGLGSLKAPQQFDRALWDRMAALTRADLEAVVGPWLTKTQIDAVLSRRDHMQRQIDGMVRERGEAVVFLPAERVDLTARRSGS